MGIYATLLGGTVGFMMGGPLGALLGGLLGSSVSVNLEAARQQRGQAPYGAQQQQIAFTLALTSLAAKVAKADGRVTQAEVRAFDEFLKTSMHMSVEERRIAGDVFNQARDNSTPASEYATQLQQVFARQPDRLRDVLTILIMIAFADGKLHPKEATLLQSIARDLGLTQNDYHSCKATFMAASGVSEIDPYEVLGVSKSVSDAELRAAHRRLVREYHPDVLQSKGLPEDFREFASQKMSAVNEAWATVREVRGI